MGPLRRRLTLCTAFAPSQALAEVCDKARPNWSPADGPVTIWTDPLFPLTNPVTLAILAIAAIALLTRRRGIAIAATLLNGLLTVAIATYFLPDPSGVQKIAFKEGCIAPPHLSLAITAAITILTLRAAILGRRT